MPQTLSDPAPLDTASGRIACREAVAPGYDGPVTHVLLHGIGSAADSWQAQLQRVASGRGGSARVLAWDAPGYGGSGHLPMAEPTAADYGARVWDWLDAHGRADAPVTLAGHSLGALMAAAAAVARPERVARLVLLSPAQGYGQAEPAVRSRKLEDRLSTLQRLGPAGMAQARAAAMLSPRATPAMVAEVARVMARIDPRGYTQAARMLAGAHLAADLARWRGPALVACGSADTVTPPAGCRALAEAAGLPYVDLGPVGHSCAVEAADAVARTLGLAAGASA